MTGRVRPQLCLMCGRLAAHMVKVSGEYVFVCINHEENVR